MTQKEKEVYLEIPIKQIKERKKDYLIFPDYNNITITI